MEAMQAEELDKLKEGDQHGIGSLIKTIWLTNEEHQNLYNLSLIRTRILTARFVWFIFIMYSLASVGYGNR